MDILLKYVHSIGRWIFVQVFTNSNVLRNKPSIASSVMMTVPPSTPIPPHVPIRIKIGSLHLAWYINLIISCNNMPTEGTPIPWLTHNTGPTWCKWIDAIYLLMFPFEEMHHFEYVLYYLFRFKIELWTNLVHWISIRKCANIWQLCARW